MRLGVCVIFHGQTVSWLVQYAPGDTCSLDIPPQREKASFASFFWQPVDLEPQKFPGPQCERGVNFP